ncbi:MAG: AAA family ATPase [Microcoleaceae cyanobacterium MO_207.B10]|nr:AAA family ATPase [Microcoleaceae cyanobacterium MO_207.B10]
MITLTGYQIINKIYHGSKICIYKAHRQLDQKPVIIKCLEKEYPTFNEILQFRNQYTISKNLNLPGIVKPLSLEKYRNGYALVMEDIGGISLRKYLTNKDISLSESLKIAISIVETLGGLSQHRVIHKDIKPSNIIINSETGDVRLIDFSISTLLLRETQEIINPNVLEGTLAYMSPEQTGRMNRGIDYRSDFYSLGITFYEILTNQLPFESTDPIELVYFHITKPATPPHELNNQIPVMVSNIIMKMIAKNAEDRYQNVLGLKHDLETCLKLWEETKVITQFELGTRDISDRFSIPEKLYGRQAEVQTLLDGFEKVAQGESEIILVAGFSGIGKTAVINEVHKPIVRQRGYFIQGKFDQFQRNIPFSAFVQAFRDLMGQLLSESEANLQEWKSKIISALGENRQVIIEVIPELEDIIGSQPAVTELSGTAAENRFNLVFLKFIQTFTTKYHPLVIFLDDLQWADTASLKLMKLLMSEKNSQYLLLLGAYRDNEVSPNHPLMLTLGEIHKNAAIVNTISLNPLELTFDLNPLVADTLHCSLELAFPLTELVYQKTQGNPFFITQFLKALHEEGLITFNYESGYWECDITQVRLLSATDDVVEFMATRLQKLSLATQEAMKLAACIGNKFDLETLAIVEEKSVTETAKNLWSALQEGLILPQTEIYKFYTTEDANILTPFTAVEADVSYKFLHDRVQQAAYLLIPEEQKQATHLKIGRLLLENIPEEERQEKIFDIVNQLNYGVDLISHPREREKLAELNLMAGKKAKLSTAYNATVDYLNIGLELLEKNCWETNYDLTLALYVETAEAAFLQGKFELMEECIKIVEKFANSIVDKIKVLEIKIISVATQGERLQGIKIALSTLKLLGIELPESPHQADIKLELEKAQANFQDKSIEDIINLPPMTDKNMLAAMSILSNVWPAAYQSLPALSDLIILRQVNLSAQYGNTNVSISAYMTYGLFLVGKENNIQIGYQFGQLAMKLLNKFNCQEIKAKNLTIFNNFIRHWQEHINKTLEPFREAYAIGLETGDLEWSCYGLINYSNQSYFMGKNLKELNQDIESTNQALASLNNIGISYHQMLQQVVLILLNDVPEDNKIIGDVYNENDMLPLHLDNQDFEAVCYIYFYKLTLCYLFEKYNQAVESAIQVRQYLDTLAASIRFSLFHFYDSLVQLAIYRDKTQLEQEQILIHVAKNQEKMKFWAGHAPMNYLHKFHLVEAEKYRVLSNHIEAMEMYDKAITGATENEYIQEVALANELAAKFYLEWNKETIAQAYLIKAYYAYAQWGALAKVKHLENCYGDLLKPLQQQYPTFTRNLTQETISYTTTDSSLLLDFSSIMKATQAISGEIKLENLLSVLMRVTLENAGAKKGYLILSQAEKLVIQAEAILNSNSAKELQIKSKQSLPLDSTNQLPTSLIYYVARTQKTVVLDHASHETKFAADPYIQNCQPKSILCIPIINRSQFIGILYLENNLTVGAFTEHRLQVLKVLTTQAAFSLENAQLYETLSTAKNQLEEYSHTLEDKVKERTEELKQKNRSLSETIKQLQHTQTQLIQTEKMSSLGQMVAGIAHEINNPTSFIYGNVNHATEYIQDLLNLIKVYQAEYPEPSEKIEELILEIDLDFINQDLQKLLNSMKIGAERIQKIVLSLRNFARLDEAAMKPVNIHDGIDSTILILQNRLNSQGKNSEIKIVKEYGSIPPVNCYVSQINQVFMNIISNGIDALEEMRKNQSESDEQPTITISTKITKAETVKIKISNNGPSISKKIQEKIFDPFFTTKPVGAGTGLGLSISYSIVVEKHHGKLTCNSAPEQGVEFIIEIPINSKVPD